MSAINNNNYMHLSTRELTWPADCNKMPNLPNLFILSNLTNHYANVVTSLDLSSDHTSVIASTHPIESYIPRMVSPKTNWDLFREDLNENLHLGINFESFTDIDEAAQQLTNAIQKAA